MKKLILCALTCSMPLAATAADFGLGVSLDHAPHVLLPINVNERLRIEPFIEVIKDESELGGGVTGEFDRQEIGVGLFLRRAIDDSAGAYYGVRWSKLSSDTTVTDSGGAVLLDEEQDGNRFSLVLGGEYVLGGHLSVAVEAYWFKLELDTASAGTTDTSDTSGTDAQAVLRFMF